MGNDICIFVVLTHCHFVILVLVMDKVTQVQLGTVYFENLSECVMLADGGVYWLYNYFFLNSGRRVVDGRDRLLRYDWCLSRKLFQEAHVREEEQTVM